MRTRQQMVQDWSDIEADGFGDEATARVLKLIGEILLDCRDLLDDIKTNTGP